MMFIQIRNVTPDELVSKTLKAMVDAKEPHVILCADLFMEGPAPGQTAVGRDAATLLESEELAYWLTMKDGKILEGTAESFRMQKAKHKDGQLCAANAGEEGEGWIESREEPWICESFEETIHQWITCVASGFIDAIMDLYPWPTKEDAGDDIHNGGDAKK